MRALCRSLRRSGHEGTRVDQAAQGGFGQRCTHGDVNRIQLFNTDSVVHFATSGDALMVVVTGTLNLATTRNNNSLVNNNDFCP